MGEIAMKYTMLCIALLIGGLLAGQNEIQRGKIKKIDVGRLTITFTANGMDRSAVAIEQTRVFGAESLSLKDRLKTLHEGDAVMFKIESRNGRDVIVGVKADNVPGGPGNTPVPRPFDSFKLKPLTELGTGEYHGSQGGLYPDGKNQRPAAHEMAGIALARSIRPLDAAGHASESGKIVLLSIGMSNTSQASDGFARQLAECGEKNPRLVFVNGAQGGMTAKMTQNANDGGTGERYWTTVDQRLRSAGVTPVQVQAVWIKQADAGPTEGFPTYAQTLQAELGRIVQTLKTRCPNVKLAYLSSRTYGGYAKTRLNPEPYAYESAFSVKWLIEAQIKGDPILNFDPARGAVKAPWLSWGPYFWTNGATSRRDGLSFTETDFAADGTHESPSGQEKVGRELLKFFQTDATTKPWFLR
jgi:Cu/Ag efflux protein CusF